MKRILENQGLWGGRLIEFDSLPSTNLWAMENIATLGHGDIVQAIRQTAGRGRFDRKWFSPEDHCLTFSVIMKPQDTEETIIPALGMVFALAVCGTLQAFSTQAALKWPNDILAEGEKIAGILLERDSGTGGIVIGVGVNVNLTRKDLESVQLMFPATSMAIKAKQTFDSHTVLKSLMSSIGLIIALIKKEGCSIVADLWQRNDYLAGKRVTINTGEAMIHGAYAGIDESGRMRIVDDTGEEQRFWTGDVTLNRI